MREEPVVNPVTGEAEDEIKVLHAHPHSGVQSESGTNSSKGRVGPGGGLVQAGLEIRGTFPDAVQGWFSTILCEYEKPHRKGSCEVTVASLSDAVRPRRAWIPANRPSNSSKARVLLVPHRSPGPGPQSRKTNVVSRL